MAKNIEALRNNLDRFRRMRLDKDDLEATIKEMQPEIIAALKNADPNGVGVVYDSTDSSKGAAFVQQNSGTEVWDEEAIRDYLRKNKALWLACSSRVLDIKKFEAEIANGNISAKVAAKFKDTTPEPKPFIRFGKITEESL